MQLELVNHTLYRVRRGQSAEEIACAFGVPPAVLAAENGLSAQPEEGQLLRIPAADCHLYRVQGGDSMSGLCGSRARFLAHNRCDALYPAQIVRL